MLSSYLTRLWEGLDIFFGMRSNCFKTKIVTFRHCKATVILA